MKIRCKACNWMYIGEYPFSELQTHQRDNHCPFGYECISTPPVETPPIHIEVDRNEIQQEFWVKTIKVELIEAVIKGLEKELGQLKIGMRRKPSVDLTDKTQFDAVIKIRESLMGA